jgi:molybdopterin converting factor small subunit
MVRVFIPPPLRRLTAGVAEVALPAKNIRQLIDALEQRYPGMGARLLDNGELAAGIAVVIDGVAAPRSLLTSLTDKNEVHFLPAISGGSSDS